ncbi:CUL2 [Bugula neritina]|uniref:CUL2 n=1 Tax=Bugula neritina TaxID=10212 RepID=A0A7J7J3J9_BUGNE|nr:CUL2 [Bugula neritina]
MSLQPKQVNFTEYWREISNTLSCIITCGKVDRRIWSDRFSDVYELCVASPEPLHNELYDGIRSFLENHVTVIIEDIKQSGDENLISAYHKHWERYSKGSQYINSLCSYLNQQFIKKNKRTNAEYSYGDISLLEPHPNYLEIGELAYDVWKKLLITPLQKGLVEAVLDEIHRDRIHTGSLNHSVVHSVINSLVSVDEQSRPNSQLVLYKSVFESSFLRTTGEYYKQKASDYISKLTCCEYLEKSIQLLNEEDLRSRKFLHPSSYQEVKAEMEKRISSDHVEMLHAECADLIEKESFKDLKNMYTLLMPIKATYPLCHCLENHIKKIGLEMVESFTQENIHQQFVEAMLQLHKKYSTMVKETFSNDQHFIAVLDKACAAVINHKSPNQRFCKSPELLVKYSDSLLRKSTKALSETDIDEKLNASITVFKYLADKDIYQGQTCGYEFTNKLHRMFTDINISADLTNKFVDYCKDKTPLDHSFSILVLQAGAWPISSQKIPRFQLPSELEGSVQAFEKFYETRFNGRKLSWVHGYSTGELKLSYLGKPYYVTLGLFQMAILLQFNEGDRFSSSELKDRTKLEDKEWNRHITPLLDSKMLVVVCLIFNPPSLLIFYYIN